MGLSANATAILLQDSRVTCLTDIYNPCPRSQVLKAEACGSSKQHFWDMLVRTGLTKLF